MQKNIFLVILLIAACSISASAELCKILEVYAQASDWTEVDLECPAGSGNSRQVEVWGQWSKGDYFDNKGTI